MTGRGAGPPSQVQLFKGAPPVAFTSGAQTGDQASDQFGAALPGGVFVG